MLLFPNGWSHNLSEPFFRHTLVALIFSKRNNTVFIGISAQWSSRFKICFCSITAKGRFIWVSKILGEYFRSGKYLLRLMKRNSERALKKNKKSSNYKSSTKFSVKFIAILKCEKKRQESI